MGACVCEGRGDKQSSRARSENRAALQLEWGSTGPANEVSERGEEKKDNKEKLRKIELKKVKTEWKAREMEGVLNSRLNRFPPSNFAGLAHFLSGSFIEEQPVGVRTQINREKEQSPVFSSRPLSLTLSVRLSLSPSLPRPLSPHLLNPLIERLPQRLT